MAHIRKVGGKWCVLEGRKCTVLPADIAAKIEAGTFKFGEYVASESPVTTQAQADKLRKD